MDENKLVVAKAAILAEAAKLPLGSLHSVLGSLEKKQLISDRAWRPAPRRPLGFVIVFAAHRPWRASRAENKKELRHWVSAHSLGRNLDIATVAMNCRETQIYSSSGIAAFPVG